MSKLEFTLFLTMFIVFFIASHVVLFILGEYLVFKCFAIFLAMASGISLMALMFSVKFGKIIDEYEKTHNDNIFIK